MPEQIKPTYHVAVGDVLTGNELLLSEQENYAGQRHQLAIHEYGNPDGIPVIFVHGGPGAGTSVQDTEFFDLSAYRVILVDQRGTGESLPRNCLEGNNTQQLMEDIETIRKSLGLGKILLFGGSWGSTLSLLYAIKYPENVNGLILRGVFLGEKAGIEAFLVENSTAVKTHPDEWRQFVEVAFPDEAGRRVYDDAPLQEKFGLLAQALFEQIKQGNWKKVGSAYSAWEVINAVPANSDDRGPALKWCQSDDGITMGLMEIFYIINTLWLKEGYIMQNVDKLRGLSIKIAQGFNDDICPPADQAFKLCAALTNINQGELQCVNLQVTDGGHSAQSPSNKMVLQQFMRDLADRFTPLLYKKAAETDKISPRSPRSVASDSPLLVKRSPSNTALDADDEQALGYSA